MVDKSVFGIHTVLSPASEPRNHSIIFIGVCVGATIPIGICILRYWCENHTLKGMVGFAALSYIYCAMIVIPLIILRSGSLKLIQFVTVGALLCTAPALLAIMVLLKSYEFQLNMLVDLFSLFLAGSVGGAVSWFCLLVKSRRADRASL